MAKSSREKIRLVSSAKTGHFYTTDKNKKNMPGKMDLNAALGLLEIRLLDHFVIGDGASVSMAARGMV